MTDINELRRLAQAALVGPDGVSLNWIKLLQDFQQKASPAVISELLDRFEAAEKDIALKERVIDALNSELNAVANERLEAVEKERDALRSLVVMRFDHDHPPQFTQGYEPHELNEPVTAEHCRWFVAEIERLRTDCDNLRAKVAEMERQEPAGYGVLYVEAANGEEDWDSIWKHRVFAEDHVKDLVQAHSDLGESIGAITVVPLCALPGAQPAPSINEGVRKVTLDFRWESEAQHHIPTIEIEFEPVSPESPNDAKGWQDRDRIAAMLTPEAKP